MSLEKVAFGGPCPFARRTNANLVLSQTLPPLLMLHENARVLNRHQPRASRLFCCLVVLNSQLHPNDLRTDSNCTLHHRRHFLGAPEHVHNVNLLRHIFQPRITPLPQHFRLVRVHRDDPVSRLLHIFRHAVARPHRIRRQSDHCNSLAFSQYFRDWVAITTPADLRPARNVHPHGVAARFSFTSFTSSISFTSRNITLIARPVHPCPRASESPAPWPTNTCHFLPRFPPKCASLPEIPSNPAAARSRPSAANHRSALSHPALPP